jgi:beta-phosphoglucomutase-like phosphatase (HAD superfamily)
VSDQAHPFDTGRVRPLVTSLDALRMPVTLDEFDGAILALEAVAADLGYGDVRPLPGSVAWIDRLRHAGKRIAVTTPGEHPAALELAGIADRADAVITGVPARPGVAQALDELGVDPARAIVVGVTQDQLAAARAADVRLAIGLARGGDTPEQLRRAGAGTIVADLQELLGPTAA